MKRLRLRRLQGPRVASCRTMRDSTKESTRLKRSLELRIFFGEVIVLGVSSEDATGVNMRRCRCTCSARV